MIEKKEAFPIDNPGAVFLNITHPLFKLIQLANGWDGTVIVEKSNQLTKNKYYGNERKVCTDNRCNQWNWL
jgi:hypothetical protein